MTMTDLETSMATIIAVFQKYSEREGDKHKLKKSELKDLLHDELPDLMTVRRKTQTKRQETQNFSYCADFLLRQSGFENVFISSAAVEYWMWWLFDSQVTVWFKSLCCRLRGVASCPGLNSPSSSCSMWKTRPLLTTWWRAWTPTATPSVTSRSSWHSSPWLPSVATSSSSTRTSKEEARRGELQ